jgi:hypothetical protein
LGFQLLELSLLRLGRFDQQRRKPGVVHTLSLMGFRVMGDPFRNELIYVLGDHADFVPTIGLALVGHTLELLDPSPRSHDCRAGENLQFTSDEAERARRARGFIHTTI